VTLIAYREQRFNGKVTVIIAQARKIIAEYQAQGFTLTLRQLYYQFVSRDLIENTLKSYKRFGDAINNARMAGMISWDAIEDRTRNLVEWDTYDSPRNGVERARDRYHRDHWEDQRWRPEVWIEKDALVGVIAGICNKYDVPYFACRGYTSQSEQWRAGQRLAAYDADGQRPIIFHLGDHDPSGIDMTRDNEDRLSLFAEMDIPVERLALNMDQVRRYHPPPNPAKSTDSRSGDYVSKFGKSCWELDALNPTIIAELIENAITPLIDQEAWDATTERQENERRVFSRILNTVNLEP
jgi:hypothetical protein